jgi:predicted RNA-binding protein YlqC (UPF0109 family)
MLQLIKHTINNILNLELNFEDTKMAVGDRSFKEIVFDIISEFVTYPDKLNIEEKAGRSSVIIGISSSERDDISQIIGKQGANITALKKIIEIIANKRNLRCTVYVVD